MHVTTCQRLVNFVSVSPYTGLLIASVPHLHCNNPVDGLTLVTDSITGVEYLYLVCAEHYDIEPQPIDTDYEQPCYCEWDSQNEEIYACDVCEPVDASL